MLCCTLTWVPLFFQKYFAIHDKDWLGTLTKFIYPSFWCTTLFIFQPFLKLEVAMWLSSSQWNACYFRAWLIGVFHVWLTPFAVLMQVNMVTLGSHKMEETWISESLIGGGTLLIETTNIKFSKEIIFYVFEPWGSLLYQNIGALL